MRSLRFASAFALSLSACAPKVGMVKRLPGTSMMVMHEETYRGLIQTNGELDEQNKSLTRAVNLSREEVTRLLAANEKLRDLLSDEATAGPRLTSASPPDQIAELYLRLLGVRYPTWRHYQALLENLKLQAIHAHVTGSPRMDADTHKAAVRDSFLQINGGSGVLLTSDGYFLSANHVVERDPIRVVYRGRPYRAERLAWNEGWDAALCRMYTDEPFAVHDIRFAPMERIRKNAWVEVLGRVDSRFYFQVGRIRNTDVATISGGQPRVGIVETTAYAEGGFSGGPVVLKDTGELIGLTSYRSEDSSFSGAARIDHFAELLTWLADRKLEALTKGP